MTPWLTSRAPQEVQVSSNDIIIYAIVCFGCCASFFIFSSITPIKISFIILIIFLAPNFFENFLKYKFDSIDFSILLYFFHSGI